MLASEGLSYGEIISRKLATELEKIITELPFRGPSMGLLFSAMNALCRVGNPSQIQLIQKIINEPDFPFVGETSQDIEEYCISRAFNQPETQT